MFYFIDLLYVYFYQMNKNTHTIQSSNKKEFDEEVNQLLKCGCELVDNGYEIVKKNKNENGKDEGPFFSWYKNGQKKWEGAYNDGEMISQKFWNKDGSLKN